MIIDKSLLERSEDFVRNKSYKIKNIVTNDDIECTFSPKLNKSKPFYQKTVNTSSLNEEDTNNIHNMEVGRRLLNYQEKYKKKLEEMKEIQKETLESFPFKPEINKKTYEILKQRDMILQEIKNKYSEENENENDNEKNHDFPCQNNKRKKEVSQLEFNEIPENDFEETSMRRATESEGSCMINNINNQQVNLSIKCLSSERNELRTSNEYFFIT
jgi:hypothetical protein